MAATGCAAAKSPACVDRRRPDKGELTVASTLSRVAGELVWTEPKTDRSRRRVPLTAGLVTELKAHRKAQITGAAARRRPVDGYRRGVRHRVRGWSTRATCCGPCEIAAQKAGIEERRRAHDAPFARPWLAGVRRAHQGGGRPARARVDRASLATSTGTPPTTPRGPRSTARRVRSGCELARIEVGYICMAKKAPSEPQKLPLTCVGLTGFEPATT